MALNPAQGFNQNRPAEVVILGDIMKKLLMASVLFLVSVVPAFSQTSIPIQNPSFEQGAPVNTFNTGPIPGWTIAGSAVMVSRVQEYSSLPDGVGVLLDNGGSSCKTRFSCANRYSIRLLFLLAIGRMVAEPYGFVDQVWVPGCMQNGSNGTIPTGTFQSITLSCANLHDTRG